MGAPLCLQPEGSLGPLCLLPGLEGRGDFCSGANGPALSLQSLAAQLGDVGGRAQSISRGGLRREVGDVEEVRGRLRLPVDGTKSSGRKVHLLLLLELLLPPPGWRRMARGVARQDVALLRGAPLRQAPDARLGALAARQQEHLSALLEQQASPNPAGLV